MLESLEPEDKTPVHYQISITGRQAAAFFFLLLAALGLSFFFGMRTGAAAKRGPDAVAAIAAVADVNLDKVRSEDERPKPTPVPEADRKLGFPEKTPVATEPAPTPKPAVKPTEKPAVKAPEKTPPPAPAPAKK